MGVGGGSTEECRVLTVGVCCVVVNSLWVENWRYTGLPLVKNMNKIYDTFSVFVNSCRLIHSLAILCKQEKIFKF